MPSEAGSGRVVSLRGLFSDSVLFGLGSAFDRMLGLLLFPVTARLLGAEGFGVVNLYTTTTVVLGLFAMMGTPQAFFRFRAELDDEGARRLISTAFWLITAGALIWVPLILVFARPINQELLGQPGTAFAWCLCVSAYGQSIKALADTRLQAESRLWTCLKINAAGAVFMRGLGLFLVVQGFGPLGMAAGEAVGMTANVLVLGFFALNDLRFALDRPSARRLLSYGVALTPGTFSSWLLTATDRYAIRVLAPDPFRVLGYYSVAQRLSSIMTIVGQAMVMGWRRFAFQNMHSEGEGRRLISSAATLMIIAGGFVAFGVSVLGDDVVYWAVGREFDRAHPLIPLLTTASFAAALQGVLRLGLLKAEKTGLVSILSIGTAILNLALNFALIPRWGGLGAAWATVVSSVALVVLVRRASQKRFPIPLSASKLSVASGLFAAVAGVAYIVGGTLSAPLLATTVQTLLVAGTPFLLAALLLDKEERTRLRQRLTALRPK